jgi:hypothetical protein
MDSIFPRRSQIQLSFSHITWKPEKHLETRQSPIMNVPLSQNWSSHSDNDPRTYLTNFSKPDVSRVKGFSLIPQHTYPVRRDHNANIGVSLGVQSYYYSL